MLVLIELVGALVLIGTCAYGAINLIKNWYDRKTVRKVPK